jgi:hypothetical protein
MYGVLRVSVLPRAGGSWLFWAWWGAVCCLWWWDWLCWLCWLGLGSLGSLLCVCCDVRSNWIVGSEALPAVVRLLLYAVWTNLSLERSIKLSVSLSLCLSVSLSLCLSVSPSSLSVVACVCLCLSHRSRRRCFRSYTGILVSICLYNASVLLCFCASVCLSVSYKLWTSIALSTPSILRNTLPISHPLSRKTKCVRSKN